MSPAPRRPRAVAALLAAVVLFAAPGCPRPADDGLEPNDTPETATPLVSGEPVEARVVQHTSDVFAVTVAGGSRIVFTLESLGGQDCVDFQVTGPDGKALYDDGRKPHQCGAARAPVFRADGVELLLLPDDAGYRLTVPTPGSGLYLLTVKEIGYADNIPTYAWDYRLTAVIE